MNFQLSLYKILFTTGLFCLLVTTGCKDSFLEIEPENTIPPEQFIETKEDLQEVLNSGYKFLADGQFMGGQHWLLSELTADHIDGCRLEGNWNAHYTRTTDIFLDTTRDLMKFAGKANNSVNLVLDKISQFDFTQEEARRIEGEAKFIRAIAHFELVRAFAHPYGYTAGNTHPGIAIWTAVTTEPQDRSSVADVYAQVVSDFTDAVNLLPTENGVYADKYAAQGYLAKVYFQMNDFQNAHDQADAVINEGGFMLADLDKRFSDFESTESVFELVSGKEASIGLYNAGGQLDGYFRFTSTIPAVTASRNLYNALSANPADLRNAWLLDTATIVQCAKFPVGDFNVALVHLTELKLIRAESAAELGVNLSTANQDLSDIYERAGLGGISGLSAELIIEGARAQREIEMMMEGNRLFELKRQAVRGNSNLEIRCGTWNCNGMIYQFPDSELRGNPNFESNAQGGCTNCAC